MIKQSPLYEQVANFINEKVNNGYYLVDEPLPSEWELARQLNVSQGTVRKALTELVLKGVLFRRQGVGTFVKDTVSDWGELPAYIGLDINLSNNPPKQEVLSLKKEHANEAVSDALGLKRGGMVWMVTSLWRYHSNIVSLDYAYLPFELSEYLTVRQIKEHNGIYSFLRFKLGVHIQIVSEELSLTMLNKDQSLLLQENFGGTALLNIRNAQDYQGKPVEWRHRIYGNNNLKIKLEY